MTDKLNAPEEVKVEATTAEVAETENVETTAASPAPVKRKKAKRTVANGHVHVSASFNNTIITISDASGNVIASSSAGACGFRGSKKGTAYAAQVAAEKAGQTAKQQFGMTKASVFIKGVGLGRDSAVRALAGMDIMVDSITDVTGVPHGGVRPRKARRV
ncbi:MAG TPA: 30S ribosomal protein S11 [Candidatus Saccharimonadales bacterium]